MNRHDCFIGRWVTFHEGHLYIIKKVYEQNKRPILILIMDTAEIPWAEVRATMIRSKLMRNGIDCIVQVIPPIASVNYGRDVGYGINYIEAPEHIKEIRGTKIRETLTENNMLISN